MMKKYICRAPGSLIAVCLTILLVRAAYCSDELPNPHWTGIHCGECHIAGKEPQLRFQGDIVQVCNRCHLDAMVRTDIHPVGITPPEHIASRIPAAWPLASGTLTCNTCHDIKPQMYAAEALQKENPLFLRGAPYEKMTDFCFSCHNRERFQQTNPHKQLDEDNRIIEKRCLYCHQSIPDPATATGVSDVTFKTARTTLCVGCHAGKSLNHPGKADHTVSVPPEMQAQLEMLLRSENTELPLMDNAVFCGTCHNPHQKGVLKRKEVTAGAGEKQFLRIPGGYDLCIACHNDKKIKTGFLTKKRDDDLLKAPSGNLFPHKPWSENKCKQCHAITKTERERPSGPSLCLREGCHKPSVVTNTYTHEPSVLENCYFCHESHSAANKKLLRTTDERICYTCHQLIQPTLSDEESENFGTIQHSVFTDYVADSSVPEGSECYFCHSSDHKRYIATMSPALCADCHITVKNVFYETKQSTKNIHIQYTGKTCSDCHDPHASEHIFQLKKTREEYK